MDCFAALAMTGEGMAQRLMEVFPPEIQPVAAGPSRAVIARSAATKQSILSFRGGMDCFAALAMTGEGMAQRLMEVFPPEIQPVAAGPSRAVIASSEATKQSILSCRGEMDCFAALAMTGKGMAQRLMEVFPLEIQPVAAGPSRAVIARSEATKQSILSCRGEMDCFAALAMTGEGMAQRLME